MPNRSVNLSRYGERDAGFVIRIISARHCSRADQPLHHECSVYHPKAFSYRLSLTR